jgi:hypothetical protein
MKINRDNYEIYFLDYLEGNLPAEDTAELLIFVENNPDLRDLIEDNELITIVPDQSINFLGKSALKKDDALHIHTPIDQITITPKNCEEFFIRFYENDLDEPEKIALANFLKDNSTFIKDFELFGNTFLKPDLAIIYPYKSKLKKKAILLPSTRKIVTVAAIAASVLLFSTVYLKYVNPTTSSVQNQKVAQTIVKPKAENKINKQTIIKTISRFPAGTNIYKTESLAVLLNNNKKDVNSNSDQVTSSTDINNHNRSQLPITFLNTRYAGDLAINSKQAPLSIDRRTDFDGIPSTAYFNPDPDAAPLNTDGRVISGKLGYTLAQGISQVAGSLARDPEAGRLLKGRISFSDIAGLGLKGYNLIADRNLSLKPEYDSTGTMTGYALTDGDRRISRFSKRLGR